MKFTPAQKSAIESKDAHLLVLAGPGTGKTRVIISKILHAIDLEKVPPDKILAVTFSKRATQEMEERLDAARPGLSEKMKVCTLHALCHEIVSHHGFRVGLERSAHMLSESEARLVFRRTAMQLPPPPFIKTGNWEAAFGDLYDLFQEAKDEGLWPENILQFAHRLPTSTVDEIKIRDEWLAIGDLFNAFQTTCFKKGFIDFGDAILSAIRILEDHPIVREELHKQFDLILVDEFQDTNYSQVRLLRSLVSPRARIVAVGDDDQSIYRFRGASYSAFKFFEEMFPPTTVVELNESFRMSPSIADASQILIRANEGRRYRPDKKIRSVRDSSIPVESIAFESYADEATWVLDQIEELLKKGVSPKEIAILVRAHSHAELILEEARARSIPLESVHGEALLRTPIVHDVMALFRLIVHPNDSVALLRLFDSRFCGLGADDIFTLVRSARGNAPVVDLLNDLSKISLSAKGVAALQKFHEIYKDLVAKSATLSASQILLQFMERWDAMGDVLLHDEDSIRYLARFHAQLVSWEKTQEFRSLRELFSVLENLVLNSSYLNEEDATLMSADRISVLSVHASKGLEFEHVFILSLVGRRFPANFRGPTWNIPDIARKESAPTKESHRDEERRLLYVAMTRAKNRLVLCSIEKKGTKPSLFLTEDLSKADASILKILKIPAIHGTDEIQNVGKEILPFHRIAPVEKKKRPLEISKEKALRLSYSQLEKFERCPLAYQFQYDFRIPVSATSSLIVGQLVHSTLESFSKALQERSIPTEEEFLAMFEKHVEALSADPMMSVTDTDREIGRRQLQKFYRNSQPFEVPEAVEKKFELKVGPHTVVGKIDRIDKTKAGYVITDYKTGRSKADDVKHADGSLQLSIYALAAKECFGWLPEELRLHYLSEGDVVSTKRMPAQLEETKAEITRIASELQMQKYPANPGHHCRWCEYERICPATKRQAL